MIFFAQKCAVPLAEEASFVGQKPVKARAERILP